MPADLNEAISSWFEPRPEPDHYNDSHNFPKVKSKLGFWDYPLSVEHWDSCATKKGGRCDCDASHGVRQAKPVDIRTDEATNAKLRDAMLNNGDHLLLIKQANGKMLLWRNSVETYLGDDVCHCYILAFCRFANIPLK